MKPKINILLLSVFIIIGLMVRNSSEGILFDEGVLEFIHSSTNPVILSIMKFISFIGSGYFLFPVIGMVIIYFYIKKKYYISKLVLVNTLGSFIFNFLLKQVFYRTRPFDFSLVEQGGLSYPLGHSMVTMSMYLTIAFLLSRNKDNKTKRDIYMGTGIFIVLMGISRMYLGVHWPTDIIGGFIMGYLLYYYSINMIKE